MKFFMVPTSLVAAMRSLLLLARCPAAAEASTARLAGLDKAGRNLSPSNVFRCACARPCPSLPCSLRRPRGGARAGQARLRQAAGDRPSRSSTSPTDNGQAARSGWASAARRRSRPTAAGSRSSRCRAARRARRPSCCCGLDGRRRSASSCARKLDRLAALLARLRRGSASSRTASACASTTSPHDKRRRRRDGRHPRLRVLARLQAGRLRGGRRQRLPAPAATSTSPAPMGGAALQRLTARRTR